MGVTNALFGNHRLTRFTTYRKVNWSRPTSNSLRLQMTTKWHWIMTQWSRNAQKIYQMCQLSNMILFRSKILLTSNQTQLSVGTNTYYAIALMLSCYAIWIECANWATLLRVSTKITALAAAAIGVAPNSWMIKSNCLFIPFIDVIGVCRDVGELQAFTAKATGKELKKRDVTLVDNS